MGKKQSSTDKLIFNPKIDIILKKIRWSGLILALIIFIINWVFLNINHQGYIRFLELNFSPDKIITSPEKLTFLLSKMTIIMSIFWIMITSKPTIESLYESTMFNRILYSLVFILFISYYLVRGKYYYLYAEDGFFESLTAVFAILASLLCLISIYYDNSYRLIKFALFILFFIFGMEEISWGQRIFGWNTPDALSRINYQNETTIHNIFNPYFQLFYPLFNLSVGFLLLNSKKLRKKFTLWLKIEKYLPLVLPCEFKLYGFIFILLALQSYFHQGELTEEIFSIFILAYTVNLVGKANAQKNSI